MKIAITLLTCGRVDYTKRTLDTLARHNPHLSSRAVLLHGNDHSSQADTRASCAMAQQAGFETVLCPDQQYGVARMTEQLFAAAAKRGCDAVLNLQNDWISDRPIPWDDIAQILADPEIYNVRLYGQFKSRTGRCGIHHGGRSPRQVVEWKPHTLPGYEVGDIHWGHPPAVTKIDAALALTAGAEGESTSRRRSGERTDLTARVIDNVFLHIGEHRTPRFRA